MRHPVLGPTSSVLVLVATSSVLDASASLLVDEQSVHGPRGNEQHVGPRGDVTASSSMLVLAASCSMLNASACLADAFIQRTRSTLPCGLVVALVAMS